MWASIVQQLVPLTCIELQLLGCKGLCGGHIVPVTSVRLHQHWVLWIVVAVVLPVTD